MYEVPNIFPDLRGFQNRSTTNKWGFT